jgi:hypothetical protein
LCVGGVLAPLELERDDREFVDGVEVVLLVEARSNRSSAVSIVVCSPEPQPAASTAATRRTSGRNFFTIS